MKPNFPGKSLSRFFTTLFLFIGVFLLSSGFGIGELNNPPPEQAKAPETEVGKLADKVLVKEMASCGGCNPIMAAVRDRNVRRQLSKAVTPGYKIKPVITYQVGCFSGGCFTRINFIKSSQSDFSTCTKTTPEFVVATVEIGCDCTVESIEYFEI